MIDDNRHFDANIITRYSSIILSAYKTIPFHQFCKLHIEIHEILCVEWVIVSSSVLYSSDDCAMIFFNGFYIKIDYSVIQEFVSNIFI